MCVYVRVKLCLGKFESRAIFRPVDKGGRRGQSDSRDVGEGEANTQRAKSKEQRAKSKEQRGRE
jgi:hypothetical protein